MANRAVVALDIGVLLGLARLDILDVNPHFRRPSLKLSTDVFWAVIDPDYQRLAPPFYDLVQVANHPLGRQREVHFRDIATQYPAVQ